MPFAVRSKVLSVESSAASPWPLLVCKVFVMVMLDVDIPEVMLFTGSTFYR